MRSKSKFKAAYLAAAAIIVAAALCCALFGGGAYAEASGDSYRNRLAYSAAEGWNNDPNGLLYANGVYHMYYQYNYDGSATDTVWGNMSWGHATSSDLVHWEERSVAIPAYQTGEDGNYYGMMFSGSAVYDKDDTSGLFGGSGGIVAVLTSPEADTGAQRQILAYSTDGGYSFSIYGEILSPDDDGGLGDGEFRDPKVFWSDTHNKWLMAVGGGSVRMYSSDNLIEWNYLGETGFWGECPDLSRFTVNGEEKKYVLIISPEDKSSSHLYNGTSRADTYYPAEYYVVGSLNEDGLFVAESGITRLSEGIDCYAFQSFNNAPDGRVYGVSWSASWKTVGFYEDYRGSYNGGMTVVCELSLTENDGGYTLSRTPVEGYESLRGEQLGAYSGTLEAGGDALADVTATEADMELTIDFSDSAASCARLYLRLSAAERIEIYYDVETETLTLDRSQSSLLAEGTDLYCIPYEAYAPLKNGKLQLRILLDRAFISLFAGGGEVSFFSAVFPSAISDGMSLTADGAVGVEAAVYAVEGIFGDTASGDGLIVTTDKIDTVVGATEAVIASSFGEGFSESGVTFSVASGGEYISIAQSGATAYISATGKGSAIVSVSYGQQTAQIDVYIYENGFVSDVDYTTRIGGFSYLREDGLYFSVGTEDAFYFSAAAGDSLIYSADISAAGLVFGASDNLCDYWVATVDFAENKVKLWRSGVGDLSSVYYDLDGADSARLTLAVSGATARVYIDGDVAAALVCTLEDYSGGRLGVNVYNAEMTFNNITFTEVLAGDNLFSFGGGEIVKVVNVTDGSYRLAEGEYAYENGKLTISESYLRTLEADTEYTFKVVTELSDFDVTVKTDFTQATVVSSKEQYIRGDSIVLRITSGVEVYKIELDGVECAFSVDGNRITLSDEATVSLVNGTYTLKAYTSQGRPTAQIVINGLADSVWEEVEEISYTFFFIDISIFGALIAVWLAFMAVKLARKFRRRAPQSR